MTRKPTIAVKLRFPAVAAHVERQASVCVPATVSKHATSA